MRNNFRCLLPLLSIFFVAGCNANGESKTNDTEVQTLPVTTLVTRDTVLYHDYVADIQAVRNVDIRARVQGFLDQTYVDEGQVVKKGEPLFRLNAAEYRTQLTRARANLSAARAEAETAEMEAGRVKMLVKKNIISETELDVARAKVTAAKAKITDARTSESNAQLSLSYTTIRAPFDGLIDRLPLKVGSLIDHGMLLTSVSDNSSVYAYFNVSENEYLEYRKARLKNPTENNDVVQLRLADGTAYPYLGKIETLEGEFDENTGSIAFRAQFPNPNHLLKHGATGRVRLSNQVSDALLLPQKATFELQDKDYVYVMDSTNHVHMRPFTPKTRFSDFYIVGTGLKPGDKVLYEGTQNVRDGAKITPRYVLMDSLLRKAP